VTGAAALAGALALSLSFAALFAARIATLLRICALQALAAALAVGAQGWERHVTSLCLAALLAAALNGLALPLVLRRMVGRAAMPLSVKLRCGVVGSASAAFALVAAPVATLTAGEPLELLPLGLSVMLLGLLIIALRSHPLLPALGLLSSQNGLVLASGAMPGLPQSVLLLAAAPLVPSLIVASVWLHNRNQIHVATPWA
jgi:hydrogenase-4 membrane subunit HyfE